MLQRGRAQLSAEGQPRRLRDGFGFHASTGPRSIERGRANVNAYLAPIFKLQRGRAQLSAEGAEANPAQFPKDRASTGPRSIERGRDKYYAKGEEGGAASTGPRSIERGRTHPMALRRPIPLLQRGRAQLSAEGSSHTKTHVKSAALQRGRAQLSAEGWRHLGLFVRTKGLQRGRAQLSAEGFRDSGRVVCYVGASTGPRSIERGRMAGARIVQGEEGRFNGAALN